ncbi:MAG: EAL domain-containing protein, partial [Pseudomonadota bacterium]|nr:EAL domain-containing protein [Pseudomonadota bacterium]
PATLDLGANNLHLVILWDVSDIRQMEKAVWFRQFGLNRAGEAILWMDERGHILDANETASRKFGYSGEELSRMAISDLNPHLSEETWSQFWQDLKQKGGVSFESTCWCQNGMVIPVEVVVNYFEYEGTGYNCALIHDITERKNSEARIERLSKLYRALSEVNQAIVRMESEEALFPLVCQMAVDFGGLKLAWIGQAHPRTLIIEPLVSYGKGSDYLKKIVVSMDPVLPEGQGPTGTAYRDNRIVIVNRYLETDMTRPWHKEAKRYDWKSCASFPILRSGKPFVVLSVYHDSENAFDEETIALLDEMVRDVSFALDGFDKEKLRQVYESNLLSSERHFRAYFERSMVGMAAVGPYRNWIEVNDTLSKMLGYSNEELMSMTWFEVSHPDELFECEEMFERIMRGELEEYEMDKRFIRKNGEILHVHLAVRAVRKEDGLLDYLVVLVDDITETRDQQRRLEQLVHHDTLTGLPNRVLLNDRLEMALAQARRTGENLAVGFMDLDGFKPVNDTFGHAMGDLLLVEVAQRMLGISRATDTVARLGGDEFVLILSGIADEAECRQLLNRIMQTLSEPFEINGHDIRISASIGVAIYPDDVTDGDSLLRHADQAMYIAKQSGRNRIHFFDVVHDHLAQVRSEGLSRVEVALERSELALHYQPKINMRSGQVIGMEALIRWNHPDRGLLAPGEFLPLVENSDFEIRLSEWVISQAMKQLSEWNQAGMDLSVSVNVPACHLQSHGFADFIASVVAGYPADLPALLELEILETAALGDMGSIIRKMEECIRLGVRFSIDDFGTGYASLAYLRRLPAAIIKIDQVFVRDMLDDMDDLSIVQGVIGLADAFQKEVIAEGVETIEHGLKLLGMGCELAQGYGIARPMEPMQVIEWVAHYKVPESWVKTGLNSSG